MMEMGNEHMQQLTQLAHIRWQRSSNGIGVSAATGSCVTAVCLFDDTLDVLLNVASLLISASCCSVMEHFKMHSSTAEQFRD